MVYAAVITVLSFMLIWQTAARVRTNKVVQHYLDKAERDRCDKVRIPVQEILDIGFSGNLGIYEGDLTKPGKRGPHRHPAYLSPNKRRKL